MNKTSGNNVYQTLKQREASNIDTNTTGSKIDDSESVKRRFGWIEITKSWLPFIIRLVRGYPEQYISVRIAETQLLKQYLDRLFPPILTCITIKSCFITKSEAELLNEINQEHSDQLYGEKLFEADKDQIVKFDDVENFLKFLSVCDRKLLLGPSILEPTDFGFIRITSNNIVSYCKINNVKFCPIFYFEGSVKQYLSEAVEVDGWNFAYLKFCFKLQGIRDELYPGDSCTVVNLETIINGFHPSTIFEEYWPKEMIGMYLPSNAAISQTNSPAAWFRAPPELINQVSPLENTLPHNSSKPAQSVVTLSSMPLKNSEIVQNVSSSNYLVNSQAQIPAIPINSVAPRIQNEVAAVQSWNMRLPVYIKPKLSQQKVSSQIQHDIGAQMFNQSQSFEQHQQSYVLVNPSSHQIPISQSLRMHSSSSTSSNTKQHITNPPPFQQTSVIQSLPLQESSSFLWRDTKKYNNAILPASTIPLSNSTDTNSSLSCLIKMVTDQDSVKQEIPKCSQAHETLKIPYMVKMAFYQGKTMYCINAKPYNYLDLAINLRDLVQVVSPSCSIEKCAEILSKRFNTVMFKINSEQLAVLNNSVDARYHYSDATLMAMLNDIQKVILPLKRLLNNLNNIPLNPAKKRCIKKEKAGPKKSQLDCSKSAAVGNTNIPNSNINLSAEVNQSSIDSKDWLNAGRCPSQSRQSP